jgi:hypothetical protein
MLCIIEWYFVKQQQKIRLHYLLNHIFSICELRVDDIFGGNLILLLFMFVLWQGQQQILFGHVNIIIIIGII